MEARVRPHLAHRNYEINQSNLHCWKQYSADVQTHTAPPPLHRRGWFWAVVGGVAAAGVATGVAVALTRPTAPRPRGSARVPSTPPTPRTRASRSAPR